MCVCLSISSVFNFSQQDPLTINTIFMISQAQNNELYIVIYNDHAGKLYIVLSRNHTGEHKSSSNDYVQPDFISQENTARYYI